MFIKLNSWGFPKATGDVCPNGNIHGRETLIIMFKIDEQIKSQLNEI